MADQPPIPDQQFQLNVNLDTTPVLYTDNVLISANEDGTVLDFTQRLGTTNQVRVVARIGMSRNHAAKFVQALGTTLAQSEGKMQTGKEKIVH
jgi:hypothetical protein